MQRQFVSSSNLLSVGYDEPSETLEIEFRGGRIYRYFGVPGFVYANLMAAGSKGSYFADHIRGRYGDTQIG